MLEESGKEEQREVGGVDHQEAVAVPPPPDEGVRPGVADHLVRLRHKRRNLYLNALAPARAACACFH